MIVCFVSQNTQVCFLHIRNMLAMYTYANNSWHNQHQPPFYEGFRCFHFENADTKHWQGPKWRLQTHGCDLLNKISSELLQRSKLQLQITFSVTCKYPPEYECANITHGHWNHGKLLTKYPKVMVDLKHHKMFHGLLGT